jgi:hypothetical protein
MNQYNIDGVTVPFDPNWSSVGISISGGADSALLAFLICNLNRNNHTTIHIINHIRMWKTRPWQQHDAEQVYKWLTHKFYKTQFVRHTNFIAPELEYGSIGPSLTDEYGKQVSGDNIQQRAYAEFICHKHDIPAYYNAVTRNPPIELGGMKERDVKRTEENVHLEIMQHMDKWALHPFRFIDKKWILEQYRRSDLMELFNLTRSCEGEFSDINYQSYTSGQHVPICGECFWCKEREWAIEQSK